MGWSVSDINELIPDGFDPMLVALTGAVVVWWGTIESMLVDEIVILNRLPSVASAKECWPLQIATGRMITQWLRVRRIVESESPDPETNLASLAETTRRLATLRHRSVHSFWTYGDPHIPQGAAALSSYKPHKGETAVVTCDEFIADVSSMAQIAGMLKSHIGHLGASHDRLQAYLRFLAKDSTFDRPSWPDVRLLSPKSVLSQ